MSNNQAAIWNKYRNQIEAILGTADWDIVLKEDACSFSEKFDSGTYSLRLGKNVKADDKNVDLSSIVAGFQLIPMINCCGILVSSGAYVRPSVANKGLGTVLNSLRIDIARELGYGVLLCTDIESNLPQRKILARNGWKDIFKFVNPRTRNTILISVINL